MKIVNNRMANKRTALYLAAVAVAFYLGFIMMGVLRA